MYSVKMKTITTQTYLADTCERITTMNNVPSDIKAQCDHLLEWMQDRCDILVADKNYEDMFALYMEWHEWVEEDNPSVMVLGQWDEEE